MHCFETARTEEYNLRLRSPLAIAGAIRDCEQAPPRLRHTLVIRGSCDCSTQEVPDLTWQTEGNGRPAAAATAVIAPHLRYEIRRCRYCDRCRYCGHGSHPPARSLWAGCLLAISSQTESADEYPRPNNADRRSSACTCRGRMVNVGSK